MTVPQTPHLPAHFHAGAYTITALVESKPDYHLYQALSPEGQTVLLREFCPQGHSTRDLLSGEITPLQGSEEAFEQARKDFEEQYTEGAEGKFRGLGTVLFLYPAQQPQTAPVSFPAPEAAQDQPVVHHAQPLRPAARQKRPAIRKPAIGAGAPAPAARRLPQLKHRSSGAPVFPLIIVGMLALFAFLGYQILKDSGTPPPQPVVTKPTPAPEKPKPVEKPQTPVVTPEPEPVVVAPEPEPEEEPEPEGPELSTSPDVIAMEKALREEAIASNGKFSTNLLKKYPYYAEAYVRDYVKKRGSSFSPDFEKWLKDTKNNREVFAMFYPPDPSVATNVAIMVDDLGLETAEKYNQLVLAFAIGRREFGMGAFDLTQQGRYVDALGKLRELRDDGTMPVPADLYCAGKAPVNWYGNAPETVDDESYKKVEAYLDNKKITPKQAWLNKAHTISEIKDSSVSEDNIAGLLHEYMYRHDQLRRQRDPFPTPVEFFTYLVDKYENHTKLRDVDRRRVDWTGVSLEATPWPAMMALSETRPLRECDSVWERYMGQRGPTRLWLYGPYRADDSKEPPIMFSFDPDPEWSRASNERKLHEGGVCGTMSLISRNSQIARGIPASPAGQPGHGNLMVTNFTGNGCWLSVGQSVDTLKNTTGFWYLRDSSAKRTGNAEYQAGLALSMNIDYEKFLDSRLAMNIYKLAGTPSSEASSEDASSSITGEFIQTAMRTILKANPFYTEAWYTLFDQLPQDLMGATKMVDEVRAAIPDGMGIKKLWSTRKNISSSVGHGDKNGKDALARHAKEYVNVISSVVLENAMQGQYDYKTFQWSDLSSWLKSESKRNSYPEAKAAYQIAYANAQGPDKLKRNVDREFKKALSFYKTDANTLKTPREINQEEMAFSLGAVCQSLPKEKLIPWMKTMLDTCPDGFKYKPKNKRETKIQTFYNSLTKNYISLVDDAEKDRVKTEMKDASDKILQLSQNGKASSRRRG